MSDIKIDFVVPWVDGSDPAWQAEFKKHSPNPASCDARFERYRDWDLMKYWFRGVEKNAPWVNKIYFITWGHVPEWLDINHPKLVIVKHEDYIPAEYLPTFSSHPIELNMHRIKGLAEHFVYFNDDFFLIDKVKPEDFFVNGLPCDDAVLSAIGNDFNIFSCVLANNISCINKEFSKNNVIKKNLRKWISLKYGKRQSSLIFLMPWNFFTGFTQDHQPQSFLKSTLKTVWCRFEEQLVLSSSSKFRSHTDVNQYLFRYWQLCTGNFQPKGLKKFGSLFNVTHENYKCVVNFIESKSKPVVVINDNVQLDFELVSQELTNSLQNIFSDKSSFEK